MEPYGGNGVYLIRIPAWESDFADGGGTKAGSRESPSPREDSLVGAFALRLRLAGTLEERETENKAHASYRLDAVGLPVAS